MGADLLLGFLVIDKDREPDWERGHAVIRALHKAEDIRNPDAFPDPPDEDDPDPLGDGGGEWSDFRVHLHGRLDEVRAGWRGDRRDTVRATIRGADVLLTGGMSWGDDPSELWGAITDLYAVRGVLDAVGFDE